MRRWLIPGIFLGLAALVACSAATSEVEREEDDEQTVGGCGVERWAVKTGTDSQAGSVGMTPQPTTIATLTGYPTPASLPSSSRISPQELHTYQLTDVTLTWLKLESDGDYHLVVEDPASGKTMIAEIPNPACVGGASPFAQKIAAARAAMDAKHKVSTTAVTLNETVSIVGVGFFDAMHGQHGVAPNGFELHAILGICWGAGCTPPGGGGGGQPDAGGGGGGGGDAGSSSIENVFLLLMENQNWSSLKGNASAPYLNGTLLPQASHAESYQNLPGIHPSEPNYIWLEAGDNLGILDDNAPSTNHKNVTQHLVNQLEAAGISWKAYVEGISGSTCPLSTSGLFAPKHVPFLFFDDVTSTNSSSAQRCIQHVRPYTELASDLASGTVARYSFIVPNLCDDMHNTTGCATSDDVKNGDTWLSKNVPTILGSSAWQHGALFITWDESEGGDFPIGMILLSPFAKGNGYASNVTFTHSSTLRTVQEIFGVGPFLGGAASSNDLADLFQPGALGGGGGGGGDAGAPDAGGGGGGCAHPICATGVKLDGACDPCATQVCASDSYCCNKSWDGQCVSEVTSVCGQSCP